jgi:hypothetical protein
VTTDVDQLVGRYTGSDELAIEGMSSGLRLFARTPRGAPCSIDLVTPPAQSVQPYEGFLRVLVVKPSSSKVRFARDGATLLISGSDAFREVLAESIETLADGSLGDHIHVEYHPDHYYLDPASAWLVVTLLTEGSTLDSNSSSQGTTRQH